ncbi:CapA family protein [Halobacteriaceae archaeon SHR40]|uniref:CapA family protein n=1 Tax=Halovenus amylolytica TaxID=2500550 RepID=UPI000FE3170C
MIESRRSVLTESTGHPSHLLGPADDSGHTTRTDRTIFEGGSADARIGFVGDVMLGRGVNRRWTGHDPVAVWGSARERLQSLSGLVINLECSISDRGHPLSEKAFNFRATPSFAKPALTDVNVALAALANNHILDFGEQALRDTLVHLDDVDIAHAGADVDRESAFEPAITTVDDLTVAMLSLTDQYSQYAANDGPGTAYAALDPSDATTRSLVEDAITTAQRADADLVVASLHWGANYETEPSDSYRAFAHWLVENGVDVVHGHSAHILQGVEVYRGRPILYDTGDFVDDYIDKPGYANKQSAIFELVIDEGSFDSLAVVPTKIENCAVELADDTATTACHRLCERSEDLGTTIEDEGNSLKIPLS